MPKKVPIKVDMTSPGSKLRYKITYPNGNEKWVKERPGHKSKRWKLREKKLLLREPAIKQFLGRLEYEVNSYLDGGEEEEGIRKVVRDFETSVGWNRARMTVRRVKRSERRKLKGLEGDEKKRQQEIVNALQIAVDFVSRRRRDKKAESIDMVFDPDREGPRIARQAGLKEVIERITDRVWSSELAQRLVEKVKRFVQTRNPTDDLTPQEAAMVYGQVDYGEVVPLSKKRDLDIEWSKHAEYRSDLRDVEPEKVNEMIQERLIEKVPHPDKKKVNFHEPGLGTVVVDYNMFDRPAEADVVTVWASELRKIAERI
jgi:predicted house-cleaning noncanonical NTP pyrophosphatase (MazG superfamily)